ncbi:competence type IV pilus major pilin ComGC [Aneurinibacillus sp. REN35]|uniref:competence type IV pilus major pilin ComGC n=1 Tax=Aneurinibacillus sp. REN35 TaxID=3237286 RepID=UPI0035282C0B
MEAHEKEKREAGFTLIELLIVIVIIGAFLALALPNYKGAVAKAQTRSCEVNQRMILTTLEAYAVENGGAYPAAADALTELVDKGYLGNTPTCPLQGAYEVTASADGKSMSVACSKHGGP